MGEEIGEEGATILGFVGGFGCEKRGRDWNFFGWERCGVMLEGVLKSWREGSFRWLMHVYLGHKLEMLIHALFASGSNRYLGRL